MKIYLSTIIVFLAFNSYATKLIDNEYLRTHLENPLIISGNFIGNNETAINITFDPSLYNREIIIENSLIQSNHGLISFDNNKKKYKITIRNCRIIGNYRNVRCERARPLVAYLHYPSKFHFYNNYIEHTGGVWINGDNPSVETIPWSQTVEGQEYITTVDIKIYENKFKNIDGRISDGEGGYLKHADPWNPKTPICTNSRQDASMPAIGIRGLPQMKNVEISWNEIINEPDNSSSGDNIVIFNSGGESSKFPIKVHNNYIQGVYAYPANPKLDDLIESPGKLCFTPHRNVNKADSLELYKPLKGFVGGGILIADGDKGSFEANSKYSCFSIAYNNQIVSTANYGIQIAVGHSNTITGNRVISSGKIGNSSDFIITQKVNFYSRWRTFKGRSWLVVPTLNQGISCINYVIKDTLKYTFCRDRGFITPTYFKDNIIKNNTVNYSAYFKDDVDLWECATGKMTSSPKIFASVPCDKQSDLTYSAPGCSTYWGNACITTNKTDTHENEWDEASYQDELDEYCIWQQKLITSNIRLGPMSDYYLNIPLGNYSNQTFSAYVQVTVENINSEFNNGSVIELKDNLNLTCDLNNNTLRIQNIEGAETPSNLIKEILIPNEFIIFPNPSFGKIKVTITKPQSGVKIIITNSSGKEVWEKVEDFSLSNQVEIDLENKPNGMYFITAISQNNNYKDKFIILK